MNSAADEAYTVHLSGPGRLRARSFLLGNGAGMVFLAPVSLNAAEGSVVPHKWFGVSEFGRKYLEVNMVWVHVAGDSERRLLSKHNQVAFDQRLSEAVRTYTVGEATVRERFFVPNANLNGLLLSLECDRPAMFTIEPQFDMRYYQAFNTDFSSYQAEVGEGEYLLVHNRARQESSGETLTFAAVTRCLVGDARIELRPREDRLVTRTYLKDEHRDKLIHRAYREIHDASPDEAPIWDSYQTAVFVPATITVASPATLAFGFEPEAEGAEAAVNGLTEYVVGVGITEARDQQHDLDFLDQARFETGNREVDLAYRQVATRFNTSLVVRKVHFDGADESTAIFAGDKYFLDPWKRDENIALEGLFACNDFETARDVLASTWRAQDPTTGRLPQILKLDEPTVYFSSDGTLWALRRLAEYTRLSGDRSLFDEKRDMIERFFLRAIESTSHGLLPSGRVIHPSFLWETWMDTAHTPRDGYPVEIELLWISVLRDFQHLVADTNPDLGKRLATCHRLAAKNLARFIRKPEDGPAYLVDSLDFELAQRDLLTPNGYLAAGLDVPLPLELASDMVVTARSELTGHTGVKSLAQRDWPKVFPSEFLDDPDNVRAGEMNSVGIYNYHRGIEWLWHNAFMVSFELRHGDPDQAYDRYLRGLVRCALHEGGVGGLDELADLHGPLGADFQAWSMSGFLAGLRAFSGVQVDAASSSIAVAPQLPTPWPYLRSRHRVADDGFALEVHRLPAGGVSVSITHENVSARYHQRIGSHGLRPVVARVNGSTASAETDEDGIAWVDVSGLIQAQVEFETSG